jgi:hypothetical protein
MRDVPLPSMHWRLAVTPDWKPSPVTTKGVGWPEESHPGATRSIRGSRGTTVSALGRNPDGPSGFWTTTS